MRSGNHLSRALHGPEWRWSLAHQLVGDHTPIASNSQAEQTRRDQTLRRAIAYLQEQARGADLRQLELHHPVVAAVVNVKLTPALEEKLKLLTLADVKQRRIAAQCGLPYLVVRTWERLHYDIRPLFNTPNMVAAVTIERELRAGRTALAARMKVALGAGEVGVQAMLRIDSGCILSEADEIYQRSLRLELKSIEVSSLPIESESQRVKFQIAAMAHIQEESRIALARERFKHRAELVRARRAAEKLEEYAPPAELPFQVGPGRTSISPAAASPAEVQPSQAA